MVSTLTTVERFTLDETFIDQYRQVSPPFGFGALSEVVFYRTYSRIKEDGTNEQWFETVRRVVEGTYNMQRRWIEFQHLPWSDQKAQESAQEMFDRMFHMKFLPPGRGLWAMGSPLTEERGLWAALSNCAFISTKDLAIDPVEPFCFLMEASMLGIGVGFDTRGANKAWVFQPGGITQRVIPDTREGWVESVRQLLGAFMWGRDLPEFDYSKIRPAGEPIKGFGGIAAGPESLRELHSRIYVLLAARIGRMLSSRDIVDIMNLIGKCVVAGNVRRTAEISLGDPNDEEYLNLKNYDLYPERAEYGWTSNNSVFCDLGMDYSRVAQRTADNGEPGYIWLDNIQQFSRMDGVVDNKDARALGTNPCSEQSLEDHELCCLVETFPSKHDSYEDFRRTLKFAYLYAKTVTLGRTPWRKTNDVLLRNRRIGLSMSGIVQAVEKVGIEEFRKWCVKGYRAVDRYDRVYSDWLKIPRSIKMTSVKPSGTVSLLAGVTSGVHWPIAKYMVRRMRISKHSTLLEPLRQAGYPIEECYGDASSVVVEFPLEYEGQVRDRSQVSLWEKLNLAAFMQRYWADNQVSVTIDFDPSSEAQQIEPALDYFQYQLKAVSFLPRREDVYQQMPEEVVTKEEYLRRSAELKAVQFAEQSEAADAERFCSGDTCVIK